MLFSERNATLARLRRLYEIVYLVRYLQILKVRHDALLIGFDCPAKIALIRPFFESITDCKSKILS